MSDLSPALLRNLLTFQVVARHGNMTRAAAELGLTTAAVSRQIRDLEDKLGIVLFTRTNKGLEPLTVAADLLENSRRALDLLGDCLAGFSARHPGGTLLVGAPRGFATLWLAPELKNFQARHPGIGVRVDGLRQDADLDRGEADLTIRFGDGRWSAGSVVKLCDEYLFPVAAPGYADGLSGWDLTERPLIHLAALPDWDRWFAAQGLSFAPHSTDLYFSDSGMVMQAAEAGAGIAMGRTSLTRHALATGRLVRLPGPAVADPLAYYLNLGPRSRSSPKVRPFADWLMAACTAP